jgi:hypothetical protein
MYVSEKYKLCTKTLLYFSSINADCFLSSNGDCRQNIVTCLTRHTVALGNSGTEDRRMSQVLFLPLYLHL